MTGVPVRGPGVASQDYTLSVSGAVLPAATTTVTIPGGQSGVSVYLTPIQDNVSEEVESATFNLDLGTGYSFSSTSSASCTIHNATSPSSSSNRPPTLLGHDITVQEDSGATFVDVLAGALDPDGDPFSVTGVSDAPNGTVTLNRSTGEVWYSPDRDYYYNPAVDRDVDQFNYTVTDARGGVATATVRVTVNPVNDPPVTRAGSAATWEDTPYSVDLRGLTTDVDTPVAALGFSAGGAVNGSVTLLADGHTARFTPAANYNGPASFQFAAYDGPLGSNTSTYSLTVRAVNDAPVPTAASFTMDEDTAAGGRVWATDADGNVLTYQRLAAPTHGTLSFNANGTYTYTPYRDYYGGDFFTFRAYDGRLYSGAAAVWITVSPVNDRPGFTGGASQAVLEDAGARAVPGWARNFVKGPANEAAQGFLGFVVSTSNEDLFSAGPSVGLGGTLWYTPRADAFGSAVVSVRLQDSGGTANGGVDLSLPYLFTITVGAVNDAPVNTLPGPLSTGEDTPRVLAGIRVADADAGGANVKVTLSVLHGTLTLSTGVSGGVSAAQVAGNGTASVVVTAPLDAINAALGAWGALSYTPGLNYHGADALTLRSEDLGNTSPPGAPVPLTDTDSVAITVTAVNDPPVATSGGATAAEDAAVDVDLRPLVSDVETPAGGLTLSAGNPAHGTVALLADGHTARFTPDANYNGPAGFTFSAWDGAALSNVATVTVNVTAVNDNPTAGDDGFAVPEGSSA